MSSAKEEILQRLKSSLSHNTQIPQKQVHYEGIIKLEGAFLLDDFKTNHTNNKGLIIECDKQNLGAKIAEILQENASKEVLYNLDVALSEDEFGDLSKICKMRAYTQSVDEIRDELFNIDTSIVQARCGVADLGILGLSANENAPRLSSLITNVCIYLLEKKNIVQHLYAGIEFIKNYEKQRTQNENFLPTNIIFVAGPSRTADIELQTVFGVHGPRKTYVLLY